MLPVHLSNEFCPVRAIDSSNVNGGSGRADRTTNPTKLRFILVTLRCSFLGFGHGIREKVPDVWPLKTHELWIRMKRKYMPACLGTDDLTEG